MLLLAVGCFQSDIAGVVRSTGSFHGIADMRLPKRLLTDPKFKQALGGDEGDVARLWTANNVAVANDPQNKSRYKISAANITDLDLPWQTHEFKLTANADAFSYVGAVTLPVEAVQLLRQHAQEAVKYSTRFNPKAANATGEIAERALAEAGISLELTFPGPVTLTNGEVDGNTVRWRWPLGDFADGHRRLAIAAGNLPWYALWRDRFLDAIGL